VGHYLAHATRTGAKLAAQRYDASGFSLTYLLTYFLFLSFSYLFSFFFFLSFFHLLFCRLHYYYFRTYFSGPSSLGDLFNSVQESIAYTCNPARWFTELYSLYYKPPHLPFGRVPPRPGVECKHPSFELIRKMHGAMVRDDEQVEISEEEEEERVLDAENNNEAIEEKNEVIVSADENAGEEDLNENAGVENLNDNKTTDQHCELEGRAMTEIVIDNLGEENGAESNLPEEKYEDSSDDSDTGPEYATQKCDRFQYRNWLESETCLNCSSTPKVMPGYGYCLEYYCSCCKCRICFDCVLKFYLPPDEMVHNENREWGILVPNNFQKFRQNYELGKGRGGLILRYNFYCFLLKLILFSLLFLSSFTTGTEFQEGYAAFYSRCDGFAGSAFNE
jgi:hypothetical protein